MRQNDEAVQQRDEADEAKHIGASLLIPGVRRTWGVRPPTRSRKPASRFPCARHQALSAGRSAVGRAIPRHSTESLAHGHVGRIVSERGWSEEPGGHYRVCSRRSCRGYRDDRSQDLGGVGCGMPCPACDPRGTSVPRTTRIVGWHGQNGAMAHARPTALRSIARSRCGRRTRG